MKTAKRVVLASVAAVALAATAVAGVAAQDKNYGGGYYDGHHKQGKHDRGGRGHDIRKMLRSLDLSDEQKQQVRDIMTQARDNRVKPDIEAVKLQMEKRQQLLESPEFNSELANELIQYRQTRMAERQLQQMQTHHKIYQILTAEQKQKLADRKAQKMERMLDKF
ncbi:MULTISPECIES: Spy/CpxP family protein refolding chaperone [Ferrimonas]|uniref:Spy/CpxP family protein refolding chaperone n=1 Tax=Ferrimonas TaxID=44011 RepID=UPI000420F021|nr:MULTISPECIES: Spy/CpxP family protein refolding chaperone [Ferrimonas]USD37682.1 Spy/CpxP family protein refolding chaperone [Ferrimonas sp. SCSIO 43195]